VMSGRVEHGENVITACANANANRGVATSRAYAQEAI
jgi:hypothetical protein